MTRRSLLTRIAVLTSPVHARTQDVAQNDALVVWDCAIPSADARDETPWFELRNRDGAAIVVIGDRDLAPMKLLLTAHEQHKRVEVRLRHE